MVEPTIFGVGTADHQCESYDPSREDIRDAWERARHQTPRGRGTDFWNRYAEDIGLAADLGCRVFRFSVAWSRFEPEPGRFDSTVLAHYRSMVEEIVRRGMEPMVTLHHFTWPLHVELQGGLISPEFPALFERYAERLAAGLGPDVRYWITFNEPSQLVYGYIKPWWEPEYMMPPGLPAGVDPDEQIEAVCKLIRNLFISNALARRAIKSLNPVSLVGANPFLLGLPPWLQRLLDWILTRVQAPQDLVKHGRRLANRPLSDFGKGSPLDGILRVASTLSTGLTGNWWHLGMAGRLPEFLCPAGCQGEQDFVGFDYYWGIRSFDLPAIGRVLDAAAGRFDRAPVWPGLLYGLLRYHQRLFPKLPIVIVENGSVAVASGMDRATYLQRHIWQAERAVAAGVWLAAYICWSITSNREWGLPFSPSSDFGLFHVDLDSDATLSRQPTPAARVYRDAIASFRGSVR